jgi:hypothetical protein
MLRVVLYVVLLGALFVGAVLWAGNAIGAWEPAVAPTPPEVSSTTAHSETPKQHHHHAKHKPRHKQP